MKSAITNPYYTDMSSSCVCIVVALAPEAQGIRDWFKLTKLSDHNFTVYGDKTQSLFVLVSGMGQLKMAMAVAYFCGRYHPNPVFLNFGVAGSQAFSVGELVAISKIDDGERCYYPDFSWQQKLKHGCCETRVLADESYPLTGVVDLEAAGFYQSANSFVARESIRVLKLISDTQVDEMNAVKESAKSLIACQREPLIKAVDELKQLADDNKPYVNHAYQTIIKQHHFTTYQSHQLDELCRRYQALFDDELSQYTAGLDHAKAVLNYISQRCDQREYLY